MLLEMSAKGWLSPHALRPPSDAAGVPSGCWPFHTMDRRLYPCLDSLQDADRHSILPFHGKHSCICSGTQVCSFPLSPDVGLRPLCNV